MNVPSRVSNCALDVRIIESHARYLRKPQQSLYQRVSEVKAIGSIIEIRRTSDVVVSHGPKVGNNTSGMSSTWMTRPVRGTAKLAEVADPYRIVRMILVPA